MGEPSHWEAEDFEWDPHKLVARSKGPSRRSSPEPSGGQRKGDSAIALL